MLTFECTVDGAGSTVWKGSNFDCTSSNNEINLLHSRFTSVEGARGVCNNGVIQAWNLKVENNYYTSHLTFGAELYTGDVRCFYDNGTQESIVGNITGMLFATILAMSDNNGHSNAI